MMLRITGACCAPSAFAIALAIPATALAVPLTGSGPNLPIPGGVDPPRQGHALTTISPTEFEGTWSAPALSPWNGTFTAFGPIPAGNSTPAGTTRYDFTTLNAGELPIGTYFGFGDVDGGSTTNETFVLTAFDSGGSIITTPWLEEPLAAFGIGTGAGASIIPGNMPGWDWNAGTGEYTIDGTTVTGGNPSLSVIIESNTAISTLEVVRTSNFANFGLSAPIPEPATALTFIACGVFGLRRR